MQHQTRVRLEGTPLGPEYRVWCVKDDCDWQDKAYYRREANGRGKHHEENPNDKMKVGK